MARAFRIIKLIFLVAGLLLCLAIPIIGLVSTAMNWEGTCNGLSGDQHACPWWEYAGTELFWASFLFIPLLFGAGVVWLGMAAAQFISARKRASHRKGGGNPLNEKS